MLKGPPDLLRRFTPTPFAADWNVMGRVVHFETNSLPVLEQINRHLEGYGGKARKDANFSCRIVSEGCFTNETEWPEMTALSQDGLSYAGIGHRGFLAVDAAEREAAAFLPESLVKDGWGFGRPFLAMLFALTSRGMDLIPIPAAAVSMGESGLLIFGPSESGKTLSSYFAGEFGLQFHADETVFLEDCTSGLRAWGDFWPARFYEGAQVFLPDLASIAQRFRYQGRTDFYLKKPMRPSAPRFIFPAACIFLERQDDGPLQLARLRRDEFQKRLDECALEAASSERERSKACSLLSDLPAFHVSYADHPSVPARLFRSLIEGPYI